MTTTAKTQRPNTYAGTCRTCGQHVAAKAGLLGPRVNGRWTVEHAECPTTTEVVVTTEAIHPRTYARRSRYGNYQARLDREHSDYMWSRYGIDE